MQVLMIFLYIVLFLVFLSVLIMIHELGHLAAAKAFNVFCLEYSIGMGPLLFKHKRKGGETQFSIRAIPFGGYVSMYGEGVELPEGVEVDESRSLNGVKAWKRVIILIAGVTMNAVLALVFFFVSNCFPQESIDYINHINVNSKFIGISYLRDGDYLRFEPLTYTDSANKQSITYYLVDNTATFNGDTTTKYAACFNFSSLKSFKHLGLEEYIAFFELRNNPVTLYSKTAISDYTSKTLYIPSDVYQAERAYKLLLDNGVITSYSVELFDKDNLDYEPKNVTIQCADVSTMIDAVEFHDGAAIMAKDDVPLDWVTGAHENYDIFTNDNFVPDFSKYVTPAFDFAAVTFTRRMAGQKGGSVDGEKEALRITQKDGVVQPFGLSIYRKVTKYNFGQIIQHTFIDFGEGSILLFRAIGDLFTNANAWQNIGGIVAVGFETTSVLQNFGFGKFLYYWGFISVNLAIFNLLPFPGLDGWQLLVVGIESATRKKIPEKVKNIVSIIGIGLLLALMMVVLFKDVFKYIFGLGLRLL